MSDYDPTLDEHYNAYLASLRDSLTGRAVSVDAGGSLAGPPGTRLVQEIVRVSVPDGDAKPWIITLGDLGGSQSTILDEFSSTVIGNTFAFIRWGRGGFNATAQVDWRIGQQFGVYGSYVEVGANLDNGAIAFAGAQNPNCFIAPGEYSGPPPTRSIQIGTVASEGGQSAILPIPRFARTLHHTAIFGADARDIRRIQFFGDAAGLVPLGYYDYGTFKTGALLFDGEPYAYPVPGLIPPFATHFQFTNNSGELMAQVRAIFELFL